MDSEWLISAIVCGQTDNCTVATDEHTANQYSSLLIGLSLLYIASVNLGFPEVRLYGLLGRFRLSR